MILYLNELSKPTCIYKILRISIHRDLLGVSPLRPQKQKRDEIDQCEVEQKFLDLPSYS